MCSRGHKVVLLCWTDLTGQMGLCLSPEQFRAIPWRIRCAWQPVGILDISFHVSVFLLSLPWARLCLWSWSLAQTRCYVGFYGGKKNTWVARPGRVLKKGEGGSVGRVVRGLWGGEEMWSSCALKVESWFHPFLPIFEFWWVGFAFPGWNLYVIDWGVFPAGRDCGPEVDSVGGWTHLVWETRWGSPAQRWFLPEPLGELRNRRLTERVLHARASKPSLAFLRFFSQSRQALCSAFLGVVSNCSPSLPIHAVGYISVGAFQVAREQPLAWDKSPCSVPANGSEWVLSSPLLLPGAGDVS